MEPRFETIDPPILLIETVDDNDELNIVTLAIGDPVLYRPVLNIFISRLHVTVYYRHRRIARILRRMGFKCDEERCVKIVDSYHDANILGTEIVKRVVEAM